MKRWIGIGWVVLSLLAACRDKEGESPVIVLDEASARYRVNAGEELVIAPGYEHVTPATTYEWERSGEVVCREPAYTFCDSVEGEYFLMLRVANEYGKAEEELKVTVLPSRAPRISLYVPEGGFQMLQGRKLVLSPTVKNGEGATLAWSVDGQPVSVERELVYEGTELGDHCFRFQAVSGEGEDAVEFKVRVCTPEEMPFAWRFPQTEFHLSQGRAVKVKAYLLENAFDAVYTWTLDGRVVATGEQTEYVFHGKEQGTHTLVLTMKNEFEEVEQAFTMEVCPPEGTYRRAVTAASQAMVNKVYEYMPAPGLLVNGYMYGFTLPETTDMQSACDTVMARWKKRWYVSLGAWGGYVIAGFDHSVENSGGDYDLAICGNPIASQSEPGVIWVSQDENGDGLPNDTWYELKGSDYGTERAEQEYAVTYYKPARPQSDVRWTDSRGKSGIVPHMAYWNPSESYYQPWVPGDSFTYYGSRLDDRISYEGGMSSLLPSAWGYTDNLGEDYFEGKAGMAGHFKIANAVTFDGMPANLQYIDFVKIQTAQVGYAPNLGEVSTEVHYISDYHLEK